MSVMRFASLGSGSRGNATLVQAGDTLVLVDCGFPARELQHRCSMVGVDPGAIDAVLITHEHGDHIRGVGACARRFGWPVWMTFGTSLAIQKERLPAQFLFSGHDGEFAIGDLAVQPVSVPHDAREPVQFVFSNGGTRLGILTDAGSITPHISSLMAGVDALLLECNHEPDLLAQGPYPPSVQARVGGDYGHLANSQSAGLLEQIDNEKLAHLVIGHLSQQNNSPEHVFAALQMVSTSLAGQAVLLAQDQPSTWFEI